MKSVNVELTGITPLLMHNIAGADLEGKTRRTTKTYKDDEEAEKSAYWGIEKGKKVLVVPSRCVYACLRTASGYFKVKGRSMKPIIAGSVRIEPEDISLGTNKYEIDKQSVVVQRARILRVRPKLKNWKLNFKIIYNEEYISDPDIIKKILEEGGVKVGLLDFRPAKLVDGISQLNQSVFRCYWWTIWNIQSNEVQVEQQLGWFSTPFLLLW